MLKRRRNKKLEKQQLKSFKMGITSKILVCQACHEEEVTVGADVAAVTCAYCVQRMVAPPDMPKSAQKSDKPRGWHFKAYFEHEGKVYSKGIEVTDAKELAKLKKSVAKSTTVVKKRSTSKTKVTAKKSIKRKSAVRRGKKNADTSK